MLKRELAVDSRVSLSGEEFAVAWTFRRLDKRTDGPLPALLHRSGSVAVLAVQKPLQCPQPVRDVQRSLNADNPACYTNGIRLRGEWSTAGMLLVGREARPLPATTEHSPRKLLFKRLRSFALVALVSALMSPSQLVGSHQSPALLPWLK